MPTFRFMSHNFILTTKDSDNYTLKYKLEYILCNISEFYFCSFLLNKFIVIHFCLQNKTLNWVWLNIEKKIQIKNTLKEYTIL